tara:strand:+ start:38373 stop:38624 length:252 start_codon:yes stop_codon:yes gene_type:complete
MYDGFRHSERFLTKIRIEYGIKEKTFKNYFKKSFSKQKKDFIFAPAYANDLGRKLRRASPLKGKRRRHWRNGRVVECGSLENC